jgi:hypothetical protein
MPTLVIINEEVSRSQLDTKLAQRVRNKGGPCDTTSTIPRIYKPHPTSLGMDSQIANAHRMHICHMQASFRM